MKISIIIPTYKPQSYLWECLSSLSNQTFPKEDYEILLVLNGCENPYKLEIESFISKRNSNVNIQLIHTLDAGVSNARNIALSYVKGEYVTFIDDDDFVSPLFLEEMYSKASSDTLALCYPYAFIDGDMTQLPFPLTSHYVERVKFGKQKYIKARKYFSGPWMKLIPSSFVKNFTFDTSLANGEDCLYMFLISRYFKYVDFTSPQAIYYRRYRNNSAITTKRSLRNLLSNWGKVMLKYTQIYLKSPQSYNMIFYFTRMLGALKNILNIEQRFIQTHKCGDIKSYKT